MAKQEINLAHRLYELKDSKNLMRNVTQVNQDRIPYNIPQYSFGTLRPQAVNRSKFILCIMSIHASV